MRRGEVDVEVLREDGGGGGNERRLGMGGGLSKVTEGSRLDCWLGPGTSVVGRFGVGSEPLTGELLFYNIYAYRSC